MLRKRTKYLDSFPRLTDANDSAQVLALSSPHNFTVA